MGSELIVRTSVVVARSFAGSVLVGFLLFVVLVAYAPDAVAFSPNNYGWNGMEAVASKYDLKFTNSLANLNQQNSILLIIQPLEPFSPSDALSVTSFVSNNGTVLIADSGGLSNSLLKQMGIGVTIESQYAVWDATYNWKNQNLPTSLVTPSASETYGFLSGVSGVAENNPAPLVLTAGSDAREIAISSPLSVEVSRSSISGGKGPPAPAVEGPFVMAAAQKIGNGVVIIVGDSQFLTNSVWNIADNMGLIGNLFSGKTVYVDTSHWQANSIASWKSEFNLWYSILSQYPWRYVFTLTFAGVGIGLLPVFGVAFPTKNPPREVKTVPQTRLNSAILERVRKDREKYGIQPS
jgi:hypothetical protein